MSFFTLEMMHNSVLYDPVKIVCLGKIWFFSYGLKCSQLIRLQYYLIISISGRNQLIPLIFLHGIRHQVKLPSETTSFGWVWPDLPTLVPRHQPLCPVRLQDSLIINISGKSHLMSQFFWMEIVIQGRQHLRLHFLVGYGQVLFSSNQIAGFFDYQCLWMESIDILDFSHLGNHPGEIAPETNFFGWVCSVKSHPMRLQDSFIINISERNQLISQLF